MISVSHARWRGRMRTCTARWLVRASGSRNAYLLHRFSLILTQETAEKFFDDADPLGAVIHREGVGDFTVTGVLAKSEHRTHLAFEALASFSTLEAVGESHLDAWNNPSTYYNYLVLGADVRSIVALLSRDYVRLLLAAVVLGTSLAYLFTRFLLQGFANRIDLNGWVFVAGVLPVVLLAVLTIGSQTLKASYTNPTDTLRQE